MQCEQAITAVSNKYFTDVDARVCNSYDLAFAGQPLVPQNGLETGSRPLHHLCSMFVEHMHIRPNLDGVNAGPAREE